MGEEIDLVCSACGYVLGDPENEVAHPDSDDNPDDPHYVMVTGEKGDRMKCTVQGQFAKPKPADEVDDGGEAPQGGGQQSQQNPQPERPPEPQPVFSLPDEESPMSILKDVVTNPHYGLNDDQIREIKSWAEDYDGQIPPKVLEDLIGLMDGINKQTSQLMRQKYELKINRYISRRQGGERGPPIGAMSQGSFGQMMNGGGGPNFGPNMSREQIQMRREQMMEEDGGYGMDNQYEEHYEDERTRREQRQDRREKAVSAATEELAVGTAQNLSQEAGEGIVRFRNVMLSVLEAKAQKDPDWFLSVSDRLDIDPFELLEPSEARKKEKQKQKAATQASVDNEVDDVLSNIQNGNPEPDPSPQPQETQPVQNGSVDGWDAGAEKVNNNTDESMDVNPMRGAPEDPFEEEEEIEDDGFGDIFGGE